jgi:hypothetical protein
MQRIPIESRYTRVTISICRTARSGYKWMLLDYFGFVLQQGHESKKYKAKEAASRAKKALTQ